MTTDFFTRRDTRIDIIAEYYWLPAELWAVVDADIKTDLAAKREALAAQVPLSLKLLVGAQSCISHENRIILTSYTAQIYQDYCRFAPNNVCKGIRKLYDSCLDTGGDEYLRQSYLARII